MSALEIYAVRNCQRLPLPRLVQDNIAKLRITPVEYKPVRPIQRSHHRNFHPKKDDAPNWREKALVDMVRRVKEREDPEYSDLFTILNKVAPSNIDKLSAEAIVLIQKRDEQFRLRVSTLLFDKAITSISYAPVMADLAVKLNTAIPEIVEDLSIQVALFPKLYDMTETVVYPDAFDPKFDDKVIEWKKQKDKRRGYALFLTHLYLRDLVPEVVLETAIQNVLQDLSETMKQTKTSQTEENTTQFVEFVFTTCNLVSKTKIKMREVVHKFVTETLATPKESVPSLNMRSRFKLEDTLKCVQ